MGKRIMESVVQTHQEQAFFFENEGQRLFAVLYSPRGAETRGGLILCDPFGEEKHFTHRTLVNFAKAACAEGFHVLRFDYRGNGDSEGATQDTTPSSQLSDIRRAIELMAVERGITRLGLLGLRVGGTLAALAAIEDPRVEFLILWAPVVHLKEHFEALIRNELIASAWRGAGIKTQEQLIERLESEGLIEVQGYCISGKAYSEFSQIDLTTLRSRFHGQVFLADVRRDPRRSDGAVRRLAEVGLAENGQQEFRTVDELEFWTPVFAYREIFPRELCARTLEWLVSKQDSLVG